MTRTAKANAKRKHARGFSILELAIVLGCISVLVAIAIPQFQRSMNRAHAAEAMMNINVIQQQLVEYYNRYNQYPSNAGAQNPTQDVSTGRQPWTEGMSGWTDIGFTGQGSYLYRYEFTPTFDAVTGQYDQATVYAFAQLTGDSTLDEWYVYLADGYVQGTVELGE